MNEPPSGPAIPSADEILFNRLDYLPPLAVQKVSSVLFHRKLNRKDVEQDLGFSSQRIYRWETLSGEPSASEIYKLAKYLDLSAIYLIDPNAPLTETPPGFELH